MGTGKLQVDAVCIKSVFETGLMVQTQRNQTRTDILQSRFFSLKV